MQTVLGWAMWATTLVAFFGMHMLYLLWEPLIIIPVAFWVITLALAFNGTFVTKRLK